MTIADFKPLNNFFQHGYVTNDYDRARQRFADYGVREFLDLRHVQVNISGDRSATLSVGLGNYGPLQIEIIQPEGGDCEVYSEILPASGFGLRLHHHGFMIRDEKEYEGLRDAYVARGAPTVIDGRNARSGVRYFYADTRPELGHYVEYIYSPGELSFGPVPQNAAQLPDFAGESMRRL